MAWLGSTVKSLDTRKELVNYIGGNTEPSRAVVTSSSGEIDSSVVTLGELALLGHVDERLVDVPRLRLLLPPAARRPQPRQPGSVALCAPAWRTARCMCAASAGPGTRARHGLHGLHRL